MLLQLLWLDIILKFAVGLALLATPRSLIRLLGLPNAEDPFWPRLLGGTLVGIAVAMVLDGQYVPGRGIGVYGGAAINLSAAAALGCMLILGRAGTAKRGRGLLWLTAFFLAMMSLLTIVAAG